ncbi:MAG: c-type cytochrome [Gemmatimonadaceae bacterium]
MNRTLLILAAAAAAAAVACGDARTAVQSGAAASAGFDPAAWRAPTESEIPNDSMGASIRRGLAIFLHSPDSLPAYASGRITCANCHLNSGQAVDAAPLTGSYARYPQYMTRTGAVVGLADRVNYCITRSLAGTRLPTDSREMQDILTFLAWLSRGVPHGMGTTLPGATGIPRIEKATHVDTAAGAAVYVAKCQSCHGADGEGNASISPAIPALWGPKSFSIGASMARPGKAADFIWHNMPWGLGRTLTQQEAHDVAAYMTSRPRPDSPGKERDWPFGGAPADAPYATAGRDAHQPPPLLRRANPGGALVPPPASVRRPTR